MVGTMMNVGILPKQMVFAIAGFDTADYDVPRDVAMVRGLPHQRRT